MPFKARHPGPGGDIGNRVVVAGEISRSAETLVHHAVEPLGLTDIAVDRVRDLLFGEAVEVVGLTEHRTDAAHLEH